MASGHLLLISIPSREGSTVTASIQAVVFDLDGTLVDSRVAVIDAVAAGIREVAERHGRGPVRVDPQVLRDALGKPAAEYYRDILDANLVDLAAEVKETATAHEVGALARGDGRLFEGVLATLDALRARQIRLASVSNAQTPYFRAALEHLELGPRFDHTECHEELPAGAQRPFKRTLLARAIAALGVSPAQTVMVGDRREDIEAGHALGCHTVGITFGFGVPEELREAATCIDAFGDLLAFVDAVR
jgi:phosphoglycolate phosphatase